MSDKFLVCLDCETFLVQEGRQVPPLVVFGVTTSDGEQWVITHKNEGMYRKSMEEPWQALDGTLTPDALVLDLFQRVRDRQGKYVNHNLVFDMAVLGETYPHLLPHIFQMYEDNLCECTILRERLIDIALGALGKDFDNKTKDGNPRKKLYNLKDLTFRYFKADLDKTTWRKGYGDLYDVPFKFWEAGAKQYVIDDTEWTLALYQAQQEKAGQDVPNSPEQARAHWALYLTGAWGMRTDPKRVSKYKAKVLKQMKIEEQALKDLGVMRPGGSRNMKAIKDLLRSVYEGLGLEPVLTDTGLEKQAAGELTDPWKYVSTGSEAVDDLLAAIKSWELETKKEVPKEWKKIDHLSAYTHTQKMLSTYVPVLEAGTTRPINPKYEAIVETGRSSCSKPNVMQLPKEPGIRECFVPRDGFVFCSVDYEALELHTLAQACLDLVGYSTMAESLNSGKDCHTLFATNYLLDNLSYEDAIYIRKHDKKHPLYPEIARARDLAKIGNFGLGGGMGAPSFKEYAKNSDAHIYLTLGQCKDLKKAWLKQWPEMVEYFRIMSNMIDPETNTATVEQLVTGRIRGGMRYTSLCNTWFQGAGGDLAKEACFMLCKDAYVMPASPLFGSRLVTFVHDETIMEHPEADAHIRGAEQARIMREAGSKICRDVPLKAEPCLMRFWSKKAVETFEDGVLVPWDGNFDEIVGINPLEKAA